MNLGKIIEAKKKKRKEAILEREKHSKKSLKQRIELIRKTL